MFHRSRGLKPTAKVRLPLRGTKTYAATAQAPQTPRSRASRHDDGGCEGVYLIPIILEQQFLDPVGMKHLVI